MKTPPGATAWEGAENDGVDVDGMAWANQDLVTALGVPQVPDA